MRTKTVNVYTYSELDERAKDKVKQWYNSDSESIFDTMNDSLNTHQGIPNTDLSFSLNNCQGDGVSFTGSWEGKELIDILNKVYNNNIPSRLLNIITNFTLKFVRISHRYAHAYTVQTELHTDRVYSDRLYKFIEEAEKAIDNWRINICKELEKLGYLQIDENYSDEYMSKTCEANNYEFYENGDLA